MVKKVFIKIPASIGNMGSGFDCAGLSLKFYNEFIVEIADKTEIKFSSPLGDVLPDEVLSLFNRSFKEALKTAGKEFFPVKINMKNNIPFKMGFGSSATVILAGVISGLSFAGRKIVKEEVLEISLPIEGHIDNLAASLYGGFAIGRADKIVVVSISPPEQIKLIAFIPEKGLSTKDARDVLPSVVPFSDAVYNLANVGLLCAAFFSKNIDLLRYAIEDKLHQPYRAKIIPHIKTLLFDRRPSSVIGGCLSGAGPSIVFFVEKSSVREALSEVKKIVEEERLKGSVCVFSPGGRTLWKVLK